MAYTKIFEKPYPDGYKNRPDKTTLVTAEIKNKETETLLAIEAYLEALQIPEKLSELTNDEGFIKNTVSNLANYYLKSETYARTETYTQEEVQALIAAAVSSVAGKLNMEVVDSLPAEGISTTTFYLLPKETAEEKNAYDEYINTDGTTSGWELIGGISTSIDLSNYYSKSETAALVAEKTTQIADDLDSVQAQVDNNTSCLTVNMLNPKLQTTTQNGVTCTNNGDGTFTLDGTASSRTDFNIALLSELEIGKKYKLVGCPSGGSADTYKIMLDRRETWNNGCQDYGNGATFTANYNSTFSIWIRIENGITVSNLVFKPMLTTNLSATYDDFVPYTGDTGKLNGDVAMLMNESLFAADDEEVKELPQVGGKVDLSNYYTKAETAALIDEKLCKITIMTEKEYNEITDKKSIAGLVGIANGALIKKWIDPSRIIESVYLATNNLVIAESYLENADLENNTWGNLICNGQISLYEDNEAIYVPGNTSGIYLSFDLNETNHDCTIYLVSKALQNDTQNRRMIEVCYSTTSNNCPIVAERSGNMQYSIFNNDTNTSNTVTEYCVIALSLSSRATSDKAKFYYNGELAGTKNQSNFGRYAFFGGSNMPNTNCDMAIKYISVVDGIDDQDTVIANMQRLMTAFGIGGAES